jgi:hypothetical protein
MGPGGRKIDFMAGNIEERKRKVTIRAKGRG